MTKVTIYSRFVKTCLKCIVFVPSEASASTSCLSRSHERDFNQDSLKRQAISQKARIPMNSLTRSCSWPGGSSGD